MKFLGIWALCCVTFVGGILFNEWMSRKHAGEQRAVNVAHCTEQGKIRVIFQYEDHDRIFCGKDPYLKGRKPWATN